MTMCHYTVSHCIFYTLGPLDELITKGLNALRECLPGDAELTNQVTTSIDHHTVTIVCVNALSKNQNL